MKWTQLLTTKSMEQIQLNMLQFERMSLDLVQNSYT